MAWFLVETFLLYMELGTGSSDFGNTCRHSHGWGVMDKAGLIQPD